MVGAISPYSYASYPAHGSSYARQAAQANPMGSAPAAQRYSAQWGAQKAAQPETPVQPVTPARPVDSKEDPVHLALMQYDSDPTAMAVRMRIQYPSRGGEAGQAASAGQQTAPALENGQEAKSAQEVMEQAECQTCKERKYQDGSDDAGVSFKTPTRIDPDQAASAVRGHENEHVVREQAKAQREDRKVVSQSVTLHTNICPECGKAYISGGTTRTVTKTADRQQPQNGDQSRQPFSAVA